MNKKMKTILLLLLVVVLIGGALIAAVYIMDRLDTENYRFSDFNEAQNEGFSQGQWPQQVPEAAEEIYAQDQYDIHHVWMRFRIDRTEAEKMVVGMRKLDDADIKELSIRRPDYVDWWFSNIVQQQPADKNALDSVIYVDENNCGTSEIYDDAVFMLDKNSDYVYYWCTDLEK